jgi:hypothetical protein
MQFRFVNEPWILRGYVPDFIALVGARLWDKRTGEIRRASLLSPYCERIASDYHWIELQLEDEMSTREVVGAGSSAVSDPISLRALRFCQSVVEVHKSLSDRGRKALEGRLRDALQAQTGFASVYQEMELAAQLVCGGYDVTFPDLEGLGHADLVFQKGNCTGAVECKALSGDAGRNIHRKGFYEFMHAVLPELSARASSPDVNEVIVITLNDRLPAGMSERNALVNATTHLLISSDIATVNGPNFTIRRRLFSDVFADSANMPEQEFYKEVQRTFGQNCHVAGIQVETGRSIVIMRSEKPDDPSKAQLDAMKKAAMQLPPHYPGFVALQYNDIRSADLTLPHFREKAALLAGYLFFETGADHIAGVYLSAYGATSVSADAYGYPGILIPNPSCRFDDGGLPFRSGLSMEAFKRVLTPETISAV